MKKIMAGAGVLVVVVLGFAVYRVGSTAAAAGAVQGRASGLLETVRQDTDGVDGSLQTPDFSVSGKDADLAAAKRTVDDYRAKLERAASSIESDRRKLRAMDGELGAFDRDPLAVPFRSGVDHQRSRVQSMISALEAAAAGMKIAGDQLQTVSAMLDAFADFTILGDRLNRDDVAGALAVFPGLNAKLQTADQLARGPSNPPQIQKMLSDMRTFSSDLQAYLQAAQRRDRSAVLSLQTRIEADAKALESFDQPGFEAYERTLLQPYIDRYGSGVRAAGFTPRTG